MACWGFLFFFFLNIFLFFYFLWSKRNSFCLHQVWRIVKDLFVYIWALLVIELLSFILFVQVILAMCLSFFFYYEFHMNDHYYNILKLQLVFISVDRKTQYCIFLWILIFHWLKYVNSLVAQLTSLSVSNRDVKDSNPSFPNYRIIQKNKTKLKYNVIVEQSNSCNQVVLVARIILHLRIYILLSSSSDLNL